MKVIFHIVEVDKWDATVSNAVDILEQDANAQIKIMVMSQAAKLFGTYSGQDFSGLLRHPNVEFIIGETALNKYNLSKEMLPVEIKVEKSVISKIVKLQNEGYAYIRL